MTARAPGCRWRVVATAALSAAVAVPTLAARAVHAQLSPAERRIVQAVDAGVPDALALVERTVNINSGTLNLAGVRRVADVLAPEFASLGFETRWVDGAEWNRAGHLIVQRTGTGRGPKLLLIGHLDTVFEQDSPFQTFVRVAGDSARGPGIADMKGGNVVMLLALRALHAAGMLDSIQVTAVFTGDEEAPGRPIARARRDLIAAADWADVAIGFENGPNDPNVAVTARRGSTQWVLRTRGTPSHSSQLFQPGVGSGAIYEAARILTAFHDSLSREDRLTFNPGTILGGTGVIFDSVEVRGTAFGKTNIVAEQAVVAGDLRALSPAQLERAKSTMRRIVGRHYPGTQATLTFDDAYPPFPDSPGNQRLREMLDAASRDAGLPRVGSVDPLRAGAADIAFVAGRVEMAIDGLGLKGRSDHTLDETADLRTLAVQAKRAAVLMARLTAR